MVKNINHWLLKSEPEDYSIQDLKRDKVTPWDGVRNYQARNFMRDDMKVGDKILFYHSNTNPPGVAGVGEVVSKSYPDPTQFDKGSKYFDPKADREEPRWFLVDIKYKGTFKRLVTLEEIRSKKIFSEMRLVQRGNRLSVMPVKKSHFEKIVKMGEGE